MYLPKSPMCLLLNAAAALVLFMVSMPLSSAAPTRDLPQIKLQWVAGTIAGQEVPRAALLLPLALADGRIVGVMQLDTGAPRSIISPAAKTLLMSEGLYREQALSTEAVSQVPLSGTLMIRTVGGGWLDDVEVATLDQVPQGVLGVIGLDFMTHRRVAVDLRDPSLTIAAPDESIPGVEALHQVALEQVGEHVAIALSIGPVTVAPALVDTGASAFGLSLFEKPLWQEVEKIGLSERCSLHIPAHQATGQEIGLQSGVFAGDICVGDRCFAAGAVTVTNRIPVPGIKGLIGMAPFADGKLVFDVPHRTLYFSQPHVSPPVCR